MKQLLHFFVGYLIVGIVFYLLNRKLIAQAIKEVASEQEVEEGFLKFWAPPFIVVTWPIMLFKKL